MTSVFLKRALIPAIVAAITLVSGTAQAARTAPNVSFFGGGNYSAGWTKVDGNQAIALSVDESAYAGAYFHRVEGAASAVAPSFDFASTGTGNSGGSPRLILFWSDGGTSELRPLTWEAGWNTVDGAQNLWDNNGGSCGYRYGTDYATTVACHAGAGIASAYLVTDSGWLNGAYTNWIDNVQIGGVTFEGPSNNGNNA